MCIKLQLDLLKAFNEHSKLFNKLISERMENFGVIDNLDSQGSGTCGSRARYGVFDDCMCLKFTEIGSTPGL